MITFGLTLCFFAGMWACGVHVANRSPVMVSITAICCIIILGAILQS